MTTLRKFVLLTFWVLVGTFLCLSGVTPVEAACPDGSVDGLTSYWTLDETVEGTYGDSVNGNHGVGAVSPVPGAGIVNGAQGFVRGSNTGINVAADASFDWNETESFSVELWMLGIPGVTCDGTAISDNEVMIGRDDSSTALHWWLGCRHTSQVARFRLDASNGDFVQLEGGPPLDDGSWHHIVAVRDADNDRVLLYVDGSEVDMADPAVYSAGFDSASAFLSLGYLNLSPFFRFNGSLDEVAIYNRALSLAEIQQHYNLGTGGSYCGFLARHELTMSIDGTGSGSVNPLGGVYHDGLALEITAAADVGSAFSGWSGDLSGNTSPTTLVMNGDKDVTATFDTDSDSDGVGDVEEDAAPNGGDGDSSGVPDSAESNVCSFYTVDGEDFVTLQVDNTLTLADCRAVNPPSDGGEPADTEFPLGFFSFQINGLAPAGATQAKLFLPAGTDDVSTYYRHGPTPADTSDHWYEFLFDGQTGADVSGNPILLDFVDGIRGDDDLDDTNGTIVDAGGPGSPEPDDTPVATSSGGGGGGGGCFIATVLP